MPKPTKLELDKARFRAAYGVAGGQEELRKLESEMMPRLDQDSCCYKSAECIMADTPKFLFWTHSAKTCASLALISTVTAIAGNNTTGDDRRHLHGVAFASVMFSAIAFGCTGLKLGYRGCQRLCTGIKNRLFKDRDQDPENVLEDPDINPQARPIVRR